MLGKHNLDDYSVYVEFALLDALYAAGDRPEISLCSYFFVSFNFTYSSSSSLCFVFFLWCVKIALVRRFSFVMKYAGFFKFY